MNIPEQLQDREFRFIKIREDSKLPLEKGWQKDSNYEYDKISVGNMYGVATGFGNLIVIDCDLFITESLVEQNLPKTFKVRTPSGGCHFYYKSPLSRTRLLKHTILEDSKGAPVHMGEIRAKGSQVIGPNSVNVKKGKIYKVENPIGIVELSIEEIDRVFGKYTIKPPEKKEWDGKTNSDAKKIMEAFPLEEVMAEYGYDLSKNPTSCLWHDSKGGASFSYNNGIWNCFHCLKKGNVIHLVAEHEGLKRGEAITLLLDRLEEREKK